MKFVYCFLIFVSFTVAGYAQQTAAAGADAISEFDVNGLKVIFKKRPSSPTISAGLFIRGGVRNATTATAGLESLTLQAATEGGTRFSREALRKELAHTGASISATAATDYSAISMVCTTGDLRRSWDVFTDLTLKPAFAADDINRVRDAMVLGLRNAASSPDSALSLLEEKVVYAGHPYVNASRGTEENLAKFTPADLLAYHKTLMETSRLLLVVVGDADPAEIKRLATASFGALPRGSYKDAPLPKLSFEKGTLDVTPRAIPTNYVRGIFLAPSLADPDYYAMRVAMAILQAVVNTEVRVKRNLSYAPDAGMGELLANSGNIYVTSTDANQSVSVMLQAIGFMQTQTLNEEAFNSLPNYFVTTHYLEQETNTAQAGELARYELIGGGWRNSLVFVEAIRQVTPEDVRTVSRKYMKNIRFVVVGDPKVIDRSVFLPG